MQPDIVAADCFCLLLYVLH